MASSVLIVTPQANFGAHIRKDLDPSRFDSFSTSDFSEAIEFVRKSNCNAVILDTELEGVELSVLDIGYALRQVKPNLHFVLIARAGQVLDTTSLAPVVTLAKPISILHLGKLLDELANPVSNQISGNSLMVPGLFPITTGETTDPIWVKDVGKAAQQLTLLTLESSAQAALITRQGELWAYAGQLSRDTAQELISSIQRYRDSAEESDLLRFVRLRSTEAEHLLYARKIAKNMIIALVFDAETSFSTIRSQAGKLVKNLSLNTFDESRQPSPGKERAPLISTTSAAGDDGGGEIEYPTISELLGKVPPPVPPSPSPWINLPWEQPTGKLETYSETESDALSEQIEDTPDEISSHPNSQFGRDTFPTVQRHAPKRLMPAVDETFSASSVKPNADMLAETRVAKIAQNSQSTRKHETHLDSEPVKEAISQGITDSVTEVAHRTLLEPVSPALFDLSYTCVLVPRLATHQLVGDFAARINEWVPQLCVAFAWRLVQILVQPEYLQWVVRVPPSTAPGYVIRIIRQQTSDRIIREFPRYKVENPSGDFWAPGYLIMGNSQPPPQKLVRDFIKQTRERQGLG